MKNVLLIFASAIVTLLYSCSGSSSKETADTTAKKDTIAATKQPVAEPVEKPERKIAPFYFTPMKIEVSKIYDLKNDTVGVGDGENVMYTSNHFQTEIYLTDSLNRKYELKFDAETALRSWHNVESNSDLKKSNEDKRGRDTVHAYANAKLAYWKITHSPYKTLSIEVDSSYEGNISPDITVLTKLKPAQKKVGTVYLKDFRNNEIYSNKIQ
jgi:hypothetical protein